MLWKLRIFTGQIGQKQIGQIHLQKNGTSDTIDGTHSHHRHLHWQMKVSAIDNDGIFKKIVFRSL